MKFFRTSLLLILAGKAEKYTRFNASSRERLALTHKWKGEQLFDVFRGYVSAMVITIQPSMHR